MQPLIHFGVATLETLFLVGALGSVIVVLISGVEDLKTVFTKDEQVSKQEPIAN